MEALSPFTRKFVALAMLLVVTVSAINLLLLPFAFAFRESLRRLGDVRFERAQAEEVVARPSPPPTPPVPPGMTILAANDGEAAARLADRLRQAATTAGLANVKATPSSAAAPATAMVDFDAEGPEAAIIAFIDGIETGQPLIRCRQWRVAKGDQGIVALQARAVAAWASR